MCLRSDTIYVYFLRTSEVIGSSYGILVKPFHTRPRFSHCVDGQKVNLKDRVLTVVLDYGRPPNVDVPQFKCVGVTKTERKVFVH